jgi:hypothetical protein
MLTRVEDSIRSRPFLVSLAMTGALLAIVLLIFAPFFSINDDVVMMMIASGTGIYNHPDAHLVFTNILLGGLLKKLYQAAPHYPWYGYYQIFIHFIASLFILYSFLRVQFSKTRLLLFIVYFLSAGLQFLVFLQFTTTAFAIGQSGILLFLSILDGSSNDPRSSKLLLLVSTLFLILSALIRIESFYMVMILAIPAFSFTFLRGYRSRPLVAVYLLFFSLLTPSIIASRTYHLLSYERDAGWKGFYEFNALRAKFNDYGLTRFDSKTEKIFSEVNWSQNDYRMLKSWFSADRDVFSTAKMKAVLSHFPSYRSWNMADLSRTFRGLMRDPGFRNSILLAILFISILKFRAHYRWLIYCTVFMIFSLTVYQALFLKLAVRVLYPMISFLLGLMFFYADNDWQLARGRGLSRWHLKTVWVYCSLLLIGVAICSSVGYSYERGQFFASRNKELNKSIRDLNPQRHQLFVIWPISFPYVALSPFQPMRELSDFRMLGLGWPGQSPIVWNILKEFEIGDLHKALYEKQNVLLVNREGRNELYKRYVREHYGVDVDFKVYYKDGNFSVYQVTKIGPP